MVLLSNVCVRPSPIHGLGVFTTRRIDAGETVLVIDDSRTVDAEHPLRPELGEYPDHCDYLAHGRVVLMQSPERHINSSCDPNTYVRWLDDERHVVARRRLQHGEEISHLSGWFVSEHLTRVKEARRRCAMRIDSPGIQSMRRP
jgi:hypothetical protein